MITLSSRDGYSDLEPKGIKISIYRILENFWRKFQQK